MAKLSAAKLAANRANAKKAGRKPGSKNLATLEKNKVAEEVRQLILKKAHPLARAGMIEAMGMTFVYRIDDVLGPKGKVIGKKHVRVTDPNEIATALDQMEEGGYDPENAFYYVTTKEPSMAAVDRLLNRAIGKVDDDFGGEGPVTTIIVKKYGAS